MNLVKKGIGAGLLFLIVFLVACGGNESPEEAAIKRPDYVVVHQLSEPASLNPSNSRGSASTMMYYNVYQELINADFKTMEIIPVLAKERAVFKPIEGSDLVEMLFEIKEEAVWENGKPITGEDIEFTLKTIKLPDTQNGHKKPSFEYIKDFEIDKDNPKKIKFICESYMLAEQVMSDLHVLPRYVYDEENLLKDYTTKMLSDVDRKAEFQADPALIKFTEAFNSVKFQRDVVQGSGPYELVEWEADQRLVFSKKDNWWGDQLKEESHWFEAYADTIIYEIIKDNSTALTALKAGRVNTMFAIDPKDYVEQCKTEEFQKNFYTFEPYMYAYDYIGFNLSKPIFDDKNTRKALAHLMNTKQLIETACAGLAEPTACFSHPTRPEQLSDKVEPYAFDIEKAKEYLTKAGWGDANGDGVLDKMINGKNTPFVIKMVTNNENNRRKTACNLLKDAAKEVGITINIETPSWKQFLPQIMQKRDFDLFVSGLISSPFDSDPRQTWHSKSIGGGGNHFGFSNQKVDDAIDALRKELDSDKRNPYYHIIHEQINDEVPVIFLITQRERIAVSKKFNNVWETTMKPGFWAPGFMAK
jgi:peptide/nickel transport system substrate-binding protein